MKHITTLVLSKQGVIDLKEVINAQVIKHLDSSKVEVALDGPLHIIDQIIHVHGTEISVLVWNASKSFTALINKVRETGTEQVVLIDIDNYVTDHLELYERSKDEQGIIVKPYEYDWVDPNE